MKLPSAGGACRILPTIACKHAKNQGMLDVESSLDLKVTTSSIRLPQMPFCMLQQCYV